GERPGEETTARRHAQSVTGTGTGTADPDAVMDFVEDLPAGVYRVKGTVRVAVGPGRRSRTFGVQAVGPNVYVSEPVEPAAKTPGSPAAGEETDPHDDDPHDAYSDLIVIGENFDAEAARSVLTAALSPA